MNQLAVYSADKRSHVRTEQAPVRLGDHEPQPGNVRLTKTKQQEPASSISFSVYGAVKRDEATEN